MKDKGTGYMCEGFVKSYVFKTPEELFKGFCGVKRHRLYRITWKRIKWPQKAKKIIKKA